MPGQADILNRAAVAAQAGTRKIPGSPNVALAGWALDSRLRGNDGDIRGNDQKRQQAPIIRNQASTEASPEAAPAATPETTPLVSSEFPDGPLEAAAGKMRRKYESIRAGTKNVAGPPTRATIRRTKELGSSLG